MAYIGLVCVDEEFSNMHAFIGTDGTGNMFTAFLDPDTLHPTIIKYQQSTMLIRPSDYKERSHIPKSEF
jgi:hypothetical protein